jgi:hypothetical protein
MSQRTGMWERCRSSAIVGAAFLGGIAGLGACLPPKFPPELFIINASGVKYPVMLSQTPAEPGTSRTQNRGHKFEVSSGIHTSRSASSNGQRVRVRTSFQQSNVSASVQLGAAVQRANWVQIDGAEFYSEDFIAYGVLYTFSSTDRELTIQGTAYR